MLKLLALSLILFSCVSQPSLKSSLLDSSSLEPIRSATPEELRLGDIRYGKQRLLERESFAWHFNRDDAFQRGAPREEGALESIKVRIFEVGQAERGKYRGFILERWDVTDESREGARQYHHYFFRSPNRLVHLAKMAKGEKVKPLWHKNKRGQEVVSYLGGRWGVSMGEDRLLDIPELKFTKRLAVPGEGIFHANSTGESMGDVEARAGELSPITTLGKGKGIYRVPGDWIVCVYPDGLAVHLKRE